MYNKEEQYKKEIRNILEAKGVDVDENMLASATRKLLQGIKIGKEDFLIETKEDFAAPLELGDDEMALDIEFIRVESLKNNASFDISKYLSKARNYVFFVENIATKIILTNALKRKRVKYQICFIKAMNSQEFSINIESRIQSINHVVDSSNKNTIIKSLVVTAKLYDVVNMYNSLGDDLFQKNVRLKIFKDVNEVENSIFRTLKENPEHFWLFNNGITMLIDGDGYDVYNSGFIKVKPIKQSRVSVINGAQTISSSIDFFNSLDIDKTIIENAIENAYVMLRIISVDGADEEDKHGIENAISISLNRQKPVGMEDIAMKTTFVERLNSLYSENNPVSFKLVRHGDEEGIQTHEMIRVAKVLQASKLQKPGGAKNLYARDVLNFSSGKFLRADIFSREMVEDEEAFNKEFKAVNCLIILESMFREYQEVVNEISFDDFENEKKSLCYFSENANYYFIAIIYYLLTDKTSCMDKFPDVDIWNFKKECDREKIKEVLIVFLKLFDKVFSEKRVLDKSFTVSYNEIKKDDLYIAAKAILKDEELEKQLLKPINKLFGIPEKTTI